MQTTGGTTREKNADSGIRRTRMICIKLVALAVGLALMIARLPLAQAMTFTVDSTTDATEANPGDGICDDGTGACTLRAAIQEANAFGGADTITLPAGTYMLSIVGRDDTAAAGDLDITEDLTLSGAGAGATTIDADGIDRVFQVLSGATVVITDVTITGGSSASGGGINNQGTLTMTNSTISGNSASVGGGGLFNAKTLTMTNSTVSGNSGGLFGGGIRNDRSTRMTLTNSTVSSNFASFGGGIDNFGTLTLTNSTISGNAASNTGGGIAGLRTLTLTHTIVAGNTAPKYADCSAGGTLISLGFNLVGAGTGCPFRGPGDITVSPADVFTMVLGPLADNGGPTQTHALLSGSPAVDGGDPTECTDDQGNPLTTDQRGVAQPQGPACDIGAYEFQPVFVRGDTDADGSRNITDGLFVLNFLFGGDAEPPCREAADTNDDNALNIADGVFILNFLFGGGPPPPPPFPDCGEDPTPAEIDCAQTHAACAGG